jgi:hypothetical protein
MTVPQTPAARSRRRIIAVALVGVLAALAAIAAYVLASNGGKPGFSLRATPSSQTVSQGGAATYRVKVERRNGFTGAVRLKLRKLPEGATASWSPRRKVPAKSNSATLTIQTSPATPVQTNGIKLKIKGRDASRKIKRKVKITLVVQPASQDNEPEPGSQQDFSLSASPTSATAYQGAQPTDVDQAAYTVDLSPSGGFAGDVSLAVSGLPSGVTVNSWSPGSTLSGGATSATLNLDVAATTSTGSYPLTMTGTGEIDGSSTQHTTNATLVVKANAAFTISGGAASSLVPGATQPLDLSLTNPYTDRDLKISGIEVTIKSTTNESGCGTENFDETNMSLATPVTLPAGRTMTLTQLGVGVGDKPAVSMLDTSSNQDACKGVTVKLDYAGSASK